MTKSEEPYFFPSFFVRPVFQGYPKLVLLLTEQVKGQQALKLGKLQ